MKTVELRYGVIFGKGDSSDWIDYEIDLIIDRFGSDVLVSYHDETHSRVTVPVALSDAFYAWVFGLGKKIRITAPEEAVEGMKKLLTDVASRYE